MYNHVTLIGNLTADPELKTTPSGVSVCRFTLAVARNYADESGNRQTDFFDCTAWRTLAENIAKYPKKGHKLAIGGSVQTRTYEDNNGQKRKVFDIIVNECEFLTAKTEAEPAQKPKTPRMEACDDYGNIPF